MGNYKQVRPIMTGSAIKNALKKGKRLFRTDDKTLTIFHMSPKHPIEREYIDGFKDVEAMDIAINNLIGQHSNYVHINPRKERKTSKKVTAK